TNHLFALSVRATSTVNPNTARSSNSIVLFFDCAQFPDHNILRTTTRPLTIAVHRPASRVHVPNNKVLLFFFVVVSTCAEVSDRLDDCRIT
ncbi:hypothetical protein BGZ91_007908, partial [Linnemannia elongata]